MPDLCSNLQWRITYFDPKLFEWDDLPDPGAPPEWKSPGLAFSGMSGINFPTQVFYTSPDYKYETRPAAVGYLCTLQADHLDTYLVKATRGNVMFRAEFTNGAILEVITKSVGWNGLEWVLSLGTDTVTLGTLTQTWVHNNLQKIPIGTVMVDFTYFYDYTHQIDSSTAYNNFGWIAAGMTSGRYALEDFPILFVQNALLSKSEQIFAILNGSQADEEVGPENEPEEPNDAQFGYVDYPIDWPDTPTTDGLSTGLLSLYKLDSGTLNGLARTLWDDNFFNGIVKNFDSPFDNLISLNLLPLDVTGTDAEVMIGNYATSITAKKITGQFVDVDGGTVEVPKIFGHQFDFKPASDCQIYLPYIGYKNIDLDDVVGGTLHLKYRIDLLTGNILAMIRVSLDDRYYHDSVEYYFSGNCATSLPLSGVNYMGYYGRMIGQIGVAAGIMGGGLGGAAMAAGGVSSMLQNKPDYQRSGNLSGCFGFMGPQTAFLLLSSPKSGIAGNLQSEKGLMSNIYSSFASLSGYNEIDVFHPTADLVKECTEEEMTEIEKLLKGGVFF